MNLKKHYDNLWYRSLSKFNNGVFEYDHLINSKNDTRYGVSLIMRPSNEIKKSIQKMFTKFRRLEPGQYYYPATDIHITALTLISGLQGFSLNQIQPAAYINVVEEALINKKAFNIRFSGITASPSCILLQGYPDNDTLQNIRYKLRELFATKGLHASIDKRYSLVAAHSTVIRFKEKINNSTAFINTIKAYRNTDFGWSHINTMELTYNDWYMKKNKSTTLATFVLPE